MNMLLFWILLVGITIATIQDLKRREVDNWLNFLLLTCGIAVIFYEAIFSNDYLLLVYGGFMVLLGFIFMHLFYMGRVFAGGDAKLLFALSPFFIGVGFLQSLFNFIIFIIFLFVSGGIYGLIYSLFLYGKNFKTSNEKIAVYLKKYYAWVFISFGVMFLIFSVFVNVFLIFGVLFIFFPILFSFAKGLEEVVMIKEIPSSTLRVGDWLSSDVRVGKKVIKASFDGVTEKEIAILRKKKKVTIRDGIPFVPGFLLAFLLYYFYSASFLTYFNLFGYLL